jgi:Flp pilus assembly protein CpaB
MNRASRFAIAAAGCALLAGWMTYSYTGSATKGDGPSRGVLATVRPLQRGDLIRAEDLSAFEQRSMPEQFAPPDALELPEDAAGKRVQVDLPAGALLTSALLAGGEVAGGAIALRKGERAVSVDVVVSPTGRELAAGDRVDLYASGYGGDQRTEQLIAGAEVLALEAGQSPSRQRATIRLASAQVAPVVRADVFAHELRAVLTP